MFKKFVLILMAFILTLTCCAAFAEDSSTSEWISVAEARAMFQEALGDECTFDVTCRSSYRIDNTTKAWLQIEAVYGDYSSATSLWNKDIMMSLSIFDMLEEHGAMWKNNGFVINPEVFPYNTPNELVFEAEWGMVYLSKARVDDFLAFCTSSVQSEAN